MKLIVKNLMNLLFSALKWIIEIVKWPERYEEKLFNEVANAKRDFLFKIVPFFSS